MKHKKLLLGLAVGTFATGMLVNQAQAVPSFARQTGLACAACHTVFPELNAFGRSFKENAYTLTGISQVSAQKTKADSGLSFDQIPPLSAMLQVTATNQKTGTNGPNTAIAFPDQLSFFFAGKISPHMGSFIQMTMSGNAGFAMDNTDIRYANHTASGITYGIDLNNNPTVQDLWNSTPAWGFPFSLGASSTATPLVADGDTMGANVAGLGAYADWGNGWYTGFSLYRNTTDLTDPVNGGSVDIDGIAPYYRVTWSNSFNNGDYLMIGAYGMQTKLITAYAAATSTTPASGYTGPEDKFSDNAVDMQYDHPLANNNMLSVHASYTNEKRDLGLSASGASTNLNSLNANVIYHWGYRTLAALGYLNNSGGDANNAAIGSYDDTAYTAQVSYLPWQNTKLTAQYVSYTKLAGQTGKAASDNNTLYLQAWLMW